MPSLKTTTKHRINRRAPRLDISFLNIFWTALATAIFLALACSNAELESTTPPRETPPPAAVQQDATPESPTSTPPVSGPPPLDTSIASVPLSDVVFDTFRGGFIRLSEASDGQMENLRDRIKPIYSPEYDSAEESDWLDSDDMVIGYESESGAFAYPVKMLNLHELVNDVIDGEPVLISYCPLCASGVVYSRTLGNQTLIFGNTSALYESGLVMFDHQTGSYWFQTLGEAIVGPLTGQRLPLLPSVTIPWGQWKQDHPDTQILSKNMGLLNQAFGNPYDRDSFAGYEIRVNRDQFAFPVSEDKLDRRLKSGDRVIAVQVGETHRAYVLTGSPDEAINDEIEGQNIAVFIRQDGPAGSAYFSAIDDRLLTFTVVGDAITDNETSSQWSFSGLAVSGPMQGRKLEAVPSRTSFWFSLVGSLPEVELHS
ncbi:MAG: DUF3179 domain-containing protein [SAR202 cluster bacterium]|jgi:hypothetical protein|nr:DUF3179 domain-containing protein [SAR202 cluster bacterium]MDP6513809.1 DUF3179 domain-containing protein [SAR202 cluster bacterium]MDP6715506.1 DUF3179 domain-containing protein [SAR202 cluster bacterium]